MIDQFFDWLDLNPYAAPMLICVACVAVLIGLVIYLARDIPIDAEEDEHARNRFIG